MDGKTLDDLARAYAGMRISRRRALWALARAGLGASAGLIGLGGAEAGCPRRRRCGWRCCPKGRVCRNGRCFARCANPGTCKTGIRRCGERDGCGCVTESGKAGLCVEQESCDYLIGCRVTADCPRGHICQIGSCCEMVGKPNVCVRRCSGVGTSGAAVSGPSSIGR